MTKQRLEAFSDGVFAIVITLLILDIRIPPVPAGDLPAALAALLPQCLTYVMSFLVVGLYWAVHHRVAHRVKLVDGPFVWLNLAWLLFVSVMPFPTSLLGRYPLSPLPIAIYGVNLIVANVTGFVVQLYMARRPELLHEPLPAGGVARLVPIYVVTNASYAAAIALAWVLPWASYVIYAVVLAWMIARSIRGIAGAGTGTAPGVSPGTDLPPRPGTPS
jgi:uncharacterized membrane protein